MTQLCNDSTQSLIVASDMPALIMLELSRNRLLQITLRERRSNGDMCTVSTLKKLINIKKGATI